MNTSELFAGLGLTPEQIKALRKRLVVFEIVGDEESLERAFGRTISHEINLDGNEIARSVARRRRK